MRRSTQTIPRNDKFLHVITNPLFYDVQFSLYSSLAPKRPVTGRSLNIHVFQANPGRGLALSNYFIGTIGQP